MENDIFWNAVISSDARFDGAFVYGVESTKIYCKPSCASRRPKRENVRFFASLVDAEAVGYRACQRCRPQSDKPDPQTAAVLRACRMLEEADEPVSLDVLSAELNLSPAHFQKTFKQIIGVSPKKYVEMKRMEKLKKELKKGSEVTAAMYEAGFGASSRLYENVSEKIGMTPAVYKRGGKNMKIDFTVAESGLGKLLVAATARGICAVNFGETGKDLESALRKEFPEAEIHRNDELLKTHVEAIIGNLSGSRKALDLPLDLRATAFQMRVWDALRKIPYGETVSYQEIAERLGNRNAVRAVAGACARNRIAVVIPCHRVVRSNGDLSGYRWGVERKRKILENEGITK